MIKLTKEEQNIIEDLFFCDNTSKWYDENIMKIRNIWMKMCKEDFTLNKK